MTPRPDSGQAPVGARIGRYEVVGAVGEGGMGTLWLAHDPTLKREVVVKGLRVDIAASTEARERLVREALVLGQLDHPAIVQVYDLVEHERQWFICMQLVQGRTIREALSDGPFSYEDILKLGRGIASGLAAAHRAGVVHRDIKPENVMVAPSGEAKILDFGIAFVSSDVRLTATDISLGTILAMAPEQFEGRQEDVRTDLFAFGSLLYEMTTGRHPFAGGSVAEVTYSISNRAPTPPAQLRDRIPHELQHLISKCLEKDPALRYQRAEEAEADFLRLDRELRSGLSDPLMATPQAGGIRKWIGRGATGEPRRIPSTVPLPAPALLALLLVGGLICGFLAAFHLPTPLRYVHDYELTPRQAEEKTRALLTSGGTGLYGFHAFTTAKSNQQLHDFEVYEKLSAADRKALHRWKPPLYYHTQWISADHLENYQFRVAADGRVIFIGHRMRPDQPTATISADSALAVARRVASSTLGLDLAKLETLPMGEAVQDGRLQRDFRWRLPGPLPGGAVGTALVRLAGTDVTEGSLDISIPPETSETIEAKSRAALPVSLTFITLAILALVALVLSIRNGWFQVPSLGFFAFATSLFVLGSVTSNDMMEGIAQRGLYRQIPQLLAVSLFASPFMGLMVSLWMGSMFGVLGNRSPETMRGLEHSTRLRLSRSTWTRSLATGILVGAFFSIIQHHLPWGLQVLGVSRWVPDWRPAKAFAVMDWAGNLGTNAAIYVCVVAGLLAIAALAGGWTRLGKWIWIPILLILPLASGTSPFVIQPPGLDYALNALHVAFMLLVVLRFGILAGVIAFVSSSVLNIAASMIATRLFDVRITGITFFAVWLIVLSVAVVLGFGEWRKAGAVANRDARRRSPASDGSAPGAMVEEEAVRG